VSTVVNSNVPTNSTLLWFVDVFIVWVTGMAQILWFKLISFKFPSDHQNFVDLCTVANVSVFVLDEPLHG